MTLAMNSLTHLKTTVAKKVVAFFILTLLPVALALLIFLVLPGNPARAAAPETEQIIELRIKNHRFSKEKITVKAGQTFKVKVINEDPTSEEFESKSMIVEKFLGPRRTLTITLGPLKPGDYDFFGCFHPSTAKGVVTAL